MPCSIRKRTALVPYPGWKSLKLFLSYQGPDDVDAFSATANNLDLEDVATSKVV